MVYKVEFPNGQVKECTANIIAENVLTQVDSEGHSSIMMEGIINYKRDESTATPKSDQCVVTK